MQFVDGHFVESYYPTIENTFSKIIKFKGQEYATEIVDTAGQVRTVRCSLSVDGANQALKDEYSILNSKHFIGIHGYMLVYSVASTQSFEMVQVIRDKILNHLVSNSAFTHSLHTTLNNLTGLRLGSHRHCREQVRSSS